MILLLLAFLRDFLYRLINLLPSQQILIKFSGKIFVVDKETILRRIAEIEEEIRRTQKNKATEKHLGKLKAKLARLREMLSQAGKKRGSYSFTVKKEYPLVAILGPPSSGKTALFSKLTGKEVKLGSFAFSTTQPEVGVMNVNGIYVQLVDLPPVIENASIGKGRGREIFAIARLADLLIITIPAGDQEMKNLIISELRKAGFRLNQKKPDIKIEKKSSGGIEIFLPPEYRGVGKETIKEILQEYGIMNANVYIGEKELTAEKLIDALQHRKFVKAIFVNTFADLAKGKEGLWVSSITEEGIDELKRKIVEELDVIRIFTVDKEGKRAEKPLVVKRGSKVKDIAEMIHKDLVENFKYAKVWGKSVKFPGQRVGLEHQLEDGDEIYIEA